MTKARLAVPVANKDLATARLLSNPTQAPPTSNTPQVSRAKSCACSTEPSDGKRQNVSLLHTIQSRSPGLICARSKANWHAPLASVTSLPSPKPEQRSRSPRGRQSYPGRGRTPPRQQRL